MALYHFVLPYHMGWRSGTPDSMVWAVFSWSLLVLLAEVLVLYAKKLGSSAGTFARRTVFTAGCSGRYTAPTLG
ncbi:MAG TPA: hypothetical protein VLW55_14125 [Burkholderiaceae bacterium]|nr:hypothetical protein [Burkholderiaceae bacterium]